jgi:hypothetical protein
VFIPIAVFYYNVGGGGVGGGSGSSSILAELTLHSNQLLFFPRRLNLFCM